MTRYLLNYATGLREWFDSQPFKNVIYSSHWYKGQLYVFKYKRPQNGRPSTCTWKLITPEKLKSKPWLEFM